MQLKRERLEYDSSRRFSYMRVTFEATDPMCMEMEMLRLIPKIPRQPRQSDDYANVTKELVNTFKWLGPPSANIILYTVGEKIEP